tara:strand:+ start:1661 stop:2446 length:786 start_codon:yes stop_codon:yes gene_type:complete
MNPLMLGYFQSEINNVVKKTFINERTPFYFISTVLLFFSIVLSVMSALYSKDNYSDFFPNEGYYYDKKIHDNTNIDKLCWYFSQITHHTIILLFFYFFLALINHKSEPYFKMIAPLSLTISFLYFYFLYPKQKLKIHELPFFNLFSHFMIIFLVFGELIYIKKYSFKETTHCFLFILTCLCAIFINYTLRNVWSYNLVKLDRFGGWKLVSKTVIIMYLFSFLFFIIKSRKLDNFGIKLKYLNKCIYSISGLINILLFNIFF